MASSSMWSRFEADSPLWSAMVALAAETCPDLDAAAYLTARLRAYDQVLVAVEAHQLLAFQLVHEFVEGEERHVYLGPLFSRGGACVPLFARLVGELLDDGRAFHVLCEAQSPRVLLLFKRLFPRSSFPRLDSPLPDDVRRTALRYARRLNHLGTLDVATLGTRNRETLYTATPGYDAVVRWLERRGVHLDRGDAQGLLVSVGPSDAERAAVRAELTDGRRAITDWRRCKAEMSSRFDNADRDGVLS